MVKPPQETETIMNNIRCSVVIDSLNVLLLDSSLSLKQKNVISRAISQLKLLNHYLIKEVESIEKG